MAAYLLRRLVWAVVLVFVLTLATYVIVYQIPADPARFLVRNQNPTERQLEEARAQLGADRPIYLQYGKFLWRLAHLDLGSSYSRDRGERVPVMTVITDAAPVTLSLICIAALIWLAIAIPLGTIAALRPRSLADRATLAFVLVAVSVHPVIVGLLLKQLFGYEWRLMPTEGYCPLNGSTYLPGWGNCGGPVDWAHHLLLPWFSLSLLFVALYSRMVRVNVIEVLDEPWVRTARGKGASEWRVVRSHVLRNALLPIVTMLGMDLGVVVGSAVFIEDVFQLPGLGALATGAARGETGFDLPVIVGVVLSVCVFVVVFNLVVDVLYVWLDPRVRLS